MTRLTKFKTQEKMDKLLPQLIKMMKRGTFTKPMLEEMKKFLTLALDATNELLEG